MLSSTYYVYGVFSVCLFRYSSNIIVFILWSFSWRRLAINYEISRVVLDFKYRKEIDGV